VGAEPDSLNDDRVGLSDCYGPVAATLAVSLFLWQATRPDGWLEAAFGALALLFWTGIGFWLLAGIFALRERQHWWVIVTAPFALYPVAMAALLYVACLQGNCI
jgi:hypothetical protein